MRISRVRYLDYLRSSAWALVKRRYDASQQPKACRVCKAKAGTFAADYHHLTYDRLGRERVTDLAIVCRPCHAAIHRRQAAHQLTPRQATAQACKARQAEIDSWWTSLTGPKSGRQGKPTQTGRSVRPKRLAEQAGRKG